MNQSIVKTERHPLLSKVSLSAQWRGKDAFPSCEVLADEVEKWLLTAQHHDQWPKYFPRLTRVTPAMRDETLKELAVAFFLENIANTPIHKWEPQRADGTPGEYLCRSGETLIFCEVKSPGWEASFVREQGASSPRLRQPKYVHVEARIVDNSFDLWYRIEQAYTRMPDDKPTLLIIADDLWFPLRCDDLAIDRVLHYPPSALPYTNPPRAGCFTSSAFNRLGAIAFFDESFSVEAGIVEYNFRIFSNPFALPPVKLPETFISRWKGKCQFCETADVEIPEIGYAN